MNYKLQKLARKKIFSHISEGLIYLKSASTTIRNSDVEHDFRQDSYFLYVAGVTSPHHSVILDANTKKSILFIPDIEPDHLVWLGRMQTTTEAKKHYGFDVVYYNSEKEAVIKKLTARKSKLFLLDDTVKPEFNTQDFRTDTTTLKSLLDSLRLYKEQGEIEAMAEAGRISTLAHEDLMRVCRPGMTEYQLQAHFLKRTLEEGARHLAYYPIIATGQNGAILHYHDNNAVIQKGDMVLVDAGCEVNGYASDITRTFPANGKFTTIQKKIYNLVLSVQNQCIDMARPGTDWLDIHKKACHMNLEGLKDLGLIRNIDNTTLIENDIHRVFMPHGIGHLLGLDVHDVGAKKATPSKEKITLRSYISLEENMAVTVEPGIYFLDIYFKSKEQRKRLKSFINWEIADQYYSVGGVRIEDDIVVTKGKPLNLTPTVKTVEDIEKLMKKRNA